AEGLVARAGEDDHAGFRIFVRVGETRLQLEERLRAEGVAHLGPVDGDLGDAAGLLVDDVLVLLDQVPLHRSAPVKASGCSRWMTCPQSGTTRKSDAGSNACRRLASSTNFPSRIPARSVV